MSQSLIDLSSDPDAMVLESGLHAMVEIPARWPSRVEASFPVVASQTLIIQSAAMEDVVSSLLFLNYPRDLQQLAIHFPFGENLTLETPFLCPLRISFCL